MTDVAPDERHNLLLPQLERWPLDPARPVIELDDVWVAFGDKQVLRGLSLQIIPGQTTVVVGRSGSGKSVLLRVMMGLQKPDRGRVTVFGRDLATCTPVEVIELRKRMGMLFQNYALFDDPEVVLFDEPTTGLDPIMIAQVDDMIALAKQQYQITSVIISHDMASTQRLADHVAFLHDGKIVFYGDYDAFMHAPLPQIQAFVEGARTSRLSRTANGEPAAEPTAAISDAPVVELIGVHKRFGAKDVLRGVDLAIYPRRTTVIIGASGSGKSVIIKHIMGLFKPERGEIRVFGEDIVPMKDRELNDVRKHFGLLFQGAALLDWLSVYENVAFPLRERGQVPRGELRDRVLDILERLNLNDIKDRMPGEISAGQRKRVGLARAIVMKPDIMIYDEPTTGQDPLRTRDIDDMIQQTQERFDITSIVISHDMASTFRIGHMIAMLYQGRIVAYGPPAALRASPDPHVQRFIHAGSVDVH